VYTSSLIKGSVPTLYMRSLLRLFSDAMMGGFPENVSIGIVPSL